MIPTNKMPKEQWSTGETLCTQGDPGNTLFILLEGSIAVETSKDGIHEKITELEAGSIIGEMSLLDNSPRSATLRATQDTTAYVISAPIFQSIISKLPEWFKAFLHVLSSRIRETNTHLTQHICINATLSTAKLIELWKGKFTDDKIPKNEFVETLKRLSNLSAKEIDLALLKLSDLELINLDKKSQNYSVTNWALFTIFIDLNIHTLEKTPFPQVELSRGKQNLLTIAIAQAKKAGAPQKETYWNKSTWETNISSQLSQPVLWTEISFMEKLNLFSEHPSKPGLFKINYLEARATLKANRSKVQLTIQEASK
ncbi:cyclic nucleotide-binding domain-containing protein [Fibrobacterales bacterium]|nr:cyclic nucleotide-binding domain-containing protein [Fibrobacterales bacterium]